MAKIVDVLLLIWVISTLAIFISYIKMLNYAAERKLLPYWKLLTGFMLPHNFFGAYVKSTKKEYGEIGVWFKVFIVSFAAFMSTLLLAILLVIFE